MVSAFLNGRNKTQRVYIVACEIICNSNVTVHKVLFVCGLWPAEVKVLTGSLQNQLLIPGLDIYGKRECGQAEPKGILEEMHDESFFLLLGLLVLMLVL